MSKQQQKPTRRLGKGGLSLIAALLVSSALIRLGADAGAAFALEASANGIMPHTSSGAPADTLLSEAELTAMLVQFRKREKDVSEREVQIEMRLQALQIADKEIEQKLAALIQAEDQLRETLAYADTAAEGDLARLTAVYESMKPKDAAALFEEMAPDFAAGFLGRMRADAAAGIMAGLSPKKAYSVSVLLAGRNAKVPKE